MKTKLLKIGLSTALIVFMADGLLFDAIKLEPLIKRETKKRRID